MSIGHQGLMSVESFLWDYQNNSVLVNDPRYLMLNMIRSSSVRRVLIRYCAKSLPRQLEIIFVALFIVHS